MPFADIVGDDLVADVAAPYAAIPLVSWFTKDDLEGLRTDIACTVRPSHSTGPPVEIGTKAHGKLKADHWKAAIEFELPVYLMKRWYAADTGALDAKDRVKHELAVCTMRLACAIHQGISYRTSVKHRKAYARHMLAYLQDLRRLRPEQSLLPSHHNAMHVPRFLKLFGPMPGWWMFPFERVIGLLQKVQTNGKLGEIRFIRYRRELTMLY